MITDYIGGEGSGETPKNDYVIYGWPLMEDFQWKIRKYFNNSCLLIKSFSGSESSSLWQTWVVYTEANGNDDVDGADDINGEPPEMHIAAQIHL